MPATILVIDDDPNSRALLTGMLQHLGYEVRTATNGAEGLEEITKQPPDMILLDLMMPRMSGFEMLGHLRGQSAEPIPIVIMSSLATPSSQMDRLPGVVGTLRKGSFSMKDVQEIVERIVGAKEKDADPPE